jgi:glycosyltransferase involved in cell wall biosynthesis
MKVNIICSDQGWIYDQFINQFKKHSKYTIVKNSKDKCDVTHYLPYYEAPANPVGPSTSWHSHQEKRADLNKKFIDVAKSMDVTISHSQKYAKMLRNDHGLVNVISIIPGVDLEKFKLRKPKKKSGKLIVGYIGRQYTSSNRKNPTLLDKISKLPFVEFRTTGGKLKINQIPKFYRELDVVASPATIEGGPMAIQEALAIGVPVLCFNNVGVANEFDTGVIKVNNSDEFIKTLKTMYVSGSKYNDLKVMEKMREQVKSQTWEKFVENHDKIWEMITLKSWKES